MFVGIAVNLLLVAVKATTGFLGHSYALIADAAESLTDVATSSAVLLGLQYASKPADEDHPHGHGKAEPLAASAVALVLLGIAVAVAVESVRMIHTPHSPPAAFTLVVLIGVLAVKEVMFRFILRTGHEVGSTALKSEAWHQRSDAITSLAAFIGITIALIGGKQYAAADDWAALLASAVIGYNALLLLRGSTAELLDQAPSDELSEQICTVATAVDGVLGTHKCFVRKVGFDYFVDLDILVDGELTVRQGHNLAHDVQDRIRGVVPSVTRVLVHVEPIDEFARRPLFSEDG